MTRTRRQKLGDFGEKLVGRSPCPKCKRKKTLKQLPINFACADIICSFCGFLAQVKSAEKENVDILPKYLLGAAWGPQKEHMDSGIYFPLFIVVVSPDRKKKALYYLPADLQSPEMFVPRKPLTAAAKRPGWQGFTIRLDGEESHKPVRLKII
jgi:Dam-replacing family